jgi:hypothetical protein
MRFPWRRTPPPVRRVDVGPFEGEQARRRAEEALERTVAETKEYAALGKKLREIRERNHLTELFYEIHRGG